ncbi:hypothetical protein [Sphingomonas psychrolutea]|uniref:Uncharacterized protein n=1 Tax=Sphingomonas psychrolutea TaxID=1259676 RepID=A0ABQ1H7M8_9SPHN|nr:hypothetical protein [Sphingomonas psychrolutea]GGA60314.1 hypothetical protein GCM10011395_33370 [Sphingomonas psychrolutea]
MFTDNDEAAYLQQRIDISLGMARAATGDCARMVHEALAARYGRRLAALRRVSQQHQSPVSPGAPVKVIALHATARAPRLPIGA